MNKSRREQLERAAALIEEAKQIIEFVCEEEQQAYDNMPEGFQDGERGEKMTTAIDAMEDAISSLDEVFGTYLPIAAE